MKPPIILTAFGTSSKAQLTYTSIEKAVKRQLPDHDVCWGFTSRIILKKIAQGNGESLQHPVELVRNFLSSGHKRLVIQPLHLFGGSEFHSLCRELSAEKASLSIGSPIFAGPDDFLALMSMLAPIIELKKEHAILVVGHGTQHPIWPVYPALEHMLQACFGSHVFVGTVEHYPDTRGLEKKIKDRGFKKVYMIPLFLVAGLHYRRDMIGDGKDSWKMRLRNEGLETDCLDKGIGQLPGFTELLCSHIRSAVECSG